ncbi:MAG: MATE family efflux transporter [Clostridia bacterium]|nr:MATE family efflux transporter [Clostridia bacterium]
MAQSEALHKEMLEGNLKKVIVKQSLPNTVGLLVIAAYSLADSFFVSTLGTDAGAAIGVVFPLHVLIQAVGYTLGMGAGSILSRALGKQDVAHASSLAFSAMTYSLLFGILIAALGLWQKEALLTLLGTPQEIRDSAMHYLIPLLYSAPAMCGVFVVSQLLRAEGMAVYSMAGLATGSVCNILLDPILISRLGFGIAGASLATLFSQIVSLLVLLSAYLFSKSRLRPFSGVRIGALFLLGHIFVAGLPSLFRQGLSGLATVLINHAAAYHGEHAVLSLSLVARIFLLVFSVCLGIGQGMMPVVGYCNGAKKGARAAQAYRFAILLSSALMLAVSLPLFLFSPQIITVFRNDPDVIRTGAFALRAQSAVLVLHGLVTCTILYLQAVGRSFLGTLLAAARQGIFFLPLIFLLPTRFGLSGLCLTQPVADVLTFLLALLLWRAAKRTSPPHRADTPPA